jgi:signal peptidase II
MVKQPSANRLVGPISALGFVVAAVTLAADQASKLLVLRSLRLGDVVTLTPFCDLVLAMNRGISYGWLPQDSEFGRWVLVMVNLAAAGLFVLWLRRVRSGLLAAAIGLLVGGALGNAIDRAAYGAVVDFISLHALGWRWYVFNIADAAIVAGVIGLLYDALSGRATK